MSDPGFQRWDIWHVHFEFSEGKGYKYRPAIVVGRGSGGAIMAMVTSVGNKLSLPHDYLIVDWREAGLDKPSLARTDRIIEVPASYVGAAGKIGKLSERDVAGLSAVLKDRIDESSKVRLGDLL